ncbi:formin-like protein 5 [Arvicola amphibius]|uniref:formin-like protein 5 n=1 Tax=Arvicola amphibius TaxID=1047088 RepID=UPI001C08D0F5|nr:formin-like protein 5 [Arvicola amphibius]
MTLEASADLGTSFLRCPPSTPRLLQNSNVRREVGRGSRAPPRMHPPSPPPRQPDHSSDPGFQERATPSPIHPPDLPTPCRSANSRTQPGGRPGRTTFIQRRPAPPLPSPFSLDRPPKGQGGVASPPPRVAQVRCRGANGKDPGGPASLPTQDTGPTHSPRGRGRGGQQPGGGGEAAAPGTAEAATRSGSAARSRCSLSSGSGLGRLALRAQALQGVWSFGGGEKGWFFVVRRELGVRKGCPRSLVTKESSGPRPSTLIPALERKYLVGTPEPKSPASPALPQPGMNDSSFE